MTFYTIEDDAIRLAVRLTPRARKNEVCGLVETGDGKSALAIRVAAPPVEGAANAALILFLSRTIDLPRSSMEIVSGENSRLKIVRLQGARPDAVEGLIRS